MTPPPPACDEAAHLLHCLGRLVAASIARSRGGGQEGALVGPAQLRALAKFFVDMHARGDSP